MIGSRIENIGIMEKDNANDYSRMWYLIGIIIGILLLRPFTGGGLLNHGPPL